MNSLKLGGLGLIPSISSCWNWNFWIRYSVKYSDISKQKRIEFMQLETSHVQGNINILMFSIEKKIKKNVSFDHQPLLFYYLTLMIIPVATLPIFRTILQIIITLREDLWDYFTV